MSDQVLIGILLISPLVGFLINGIIGRNRFNAKISGSIATLASFISFIGAIILVYQVNHLADRSRGIAVHFFDWLKVGSFSLSAAFVIDPISSIMILVITGVGSLIHLFSIGYMSEDDGVVKYFSYLNLFLFNMLILVTGDNLPLMFVGWEGVGLCSYLLIGFWFKDEDKAQAGMKAFVVNRIGDAAFILGMFVLYTEYGTLNLRELNFLAPSAAIFSWIDPTTLGTLLLFIGATGKSAQIPLYVWLPDAMAGPTPVSALIHAATMVTAGVYMIVRLSFLYMAAPYTLMVVAIVGGITAIFSASIGLAQWDIKKVLAYSTVSQLGYMFLACGVGAFGPALFHLMTHAFFKALMFLGAGSVIHGMHHEQDMGNMGGLKKFMPVTYVTFFIGWLAIIGIPPFAGFFSKDEILWMAFASERGHWMLWVIGFIGALLTAFYMTRLMALTFWGASRFESQTHPPHESPVVMLIPLIVLAILSFLGGWVGIPHILSEWLPGHPPHILENWIGKTVASVSLRPIASSIEWALMGTSVGGATVFAFLAWFLYVKNLKFIKSISSQWVSLYNLIKNKYYVDELYEKFFVTPIIHLSKELWFYFDVRFIDQAAQLVSKITLDFGKFVTRFQNGNMQFYAFLVTVGLFIFLFLSLGS